ncbi:MAG: hypothetical protein R3B47_07660 [Bacteroidia bacterium]
MQGISGVLYEYLQSVQSYIAPPITAVFLLGIFYKRINGHGAFVTLVMGFIVGAIRIILELTKSNFAEGSFLYNVGDMNFLTFSAWFFLACVVVLVGVSLATAPPVIEKVRNLTFSTVSAEEKLKSKNSYGWVDIAVSVVVVIIVASVMMFFNGK